MLLDLQNTAFGYVPRRPVVRLEGTVRVAPRTCLGIFGPNGAGKTTLVRGLLGLIEPMDGQVRRAPAMRQGYLPQHRHIDHAWPMSARDAATLAASAARRFGWAVGCRRRVSSMLEVLQVSHLADQPFAILSGGQQQRVLLAGALAEEPALLVLDEPTDGLDVGSRELLLRVLRQSVGRGLGAVVVSHNEGDFLALCQSVLWLEPASEPDQPTLACEISLSTLRERLAAGRTP